MPEFPLEVNVDDFRLSQIKGWKVPEEVGTPSKGRRRRRSYGMPSSEDFSNSVSGDRHSCRLRFQQSPVDVSQLVLINVCIECNYLFHYSH